MFNAELWMLYGRLRRGSANRRRLAVEPFLNLEVVLPGTLEEKTMDGKVIVGMNVHQEICCLQMAGKLLLEKDQVGGLNKSF